MENAMLYAKIHQGFPNRMIQINLRDLISVKPVK